MFEVQPLTEKRIDNLGTGVNGVLGFDERVARGVDDGLPTGVPAGVPLADRGSDFPRFPASK